MHSSVSVCFVRKLIFENEIKCLCQFNFFYNSWRGSLGPDENRPRAKLGLWTASGTVGGTLISLIRLSLAFVNSPRTESGLKGVVVLLLSPLHFV